MKTPRILQAACLALLGTAFVSSSAIALVFPLQISADDRRIVDAAGEVILFAGDAAWSIATQLTKAEVTTYFADRQSRGMNAILVPMMVSADFNGTSNNRDGDPPLLVPGDFTTPNDAYFAHLDWMVDEALAHDIVLFFYPAYAGYQCRIEGWCSEMVANGPVVMRDWGRWIGNRYRDRPNIVWVHGGDVAAGNYGAMDVVDAVAEGILEVDTAHLHTAHCDRYHSGVECYDRPWLDFNTTYGECNTTPAEVRNDYQRVPTLATLYIEGRYELERDWTEVCLRSQAYWALLGGTGGHFFGSGEIWNFDPGWENWLETQGARSMFHFTDLLRSRRWDLFVPDYDASVLVAGHGDIATSGYASAAHASDGSSILVYTPTQRTLSVALDSIAGGGVEVWWYDPSDGSAQFEGAYDAFGTRDFVPPTNQDWVLVIDDLAANLQNVWEVTTDVATTGRLRLASAIPNPFNPRTELRFEAPAGAPVRLTAYDTRGREIAVLFHATASGIEERVVWDATGLSSGVYYLRLAVSGHVVTRKVALVR
jgi:hypothetical protein